MTGKILATQAARAFSDLLNRVQHRGECFLIERGGKTIARLSPAQNRGVKLEQLVSLLQQLVPPDPKFSADIRQIKKRRR